MLAWSAEEAGRIIETYKIFENKPPDMIMERQESGPYQKVLIRLLANGSPLKLVVVLLD
jgi:DNA excision repair protein ERCC-1